MALIGCKILVDHVHVHIVNAMNLWLLCKDTYVNLRKTDFTHLL